MSRDAGTVTGSGTGASEAPAPLHREPAQNQLGLLIAWCTGGPNRIGETALLAAGSEAILGRGAGTGEGDGAAPRVAFVRQRPGSNAATPPLGGSGLSREQLRLRATGELLHVERLGRRPMELRGVEVDRCTLRPGDVLHVRGQLVLLCVRRPAVLAELKHFPPSALGPFGQPDAFGMVGESPEAHLLRDRLAFAAEAARHTLLLGETGTGKELAAAAIHRLSSRCGAPLVSRNAATLPPSLIDAELFGNARNYPNAGMPERIGLFGEAHGGTLFLDEIAELSTELQAHLLRVLDSRGEYQRLGESTARRTDLVLVGATNRAVSVLKDDLRARLPLSIELPPLRARREDLPLLVRNLLARASERSPKIVERFFAQVDDGAHPRLDPKLLLDLLGQPLSGNVRELEALLWRAIETSPDDTLTVVDETPGAALASPDGDGAEGASGEGPSAETIRASLEEQGGNLTRAAALLGMPSRFALYRRMKKLGIEPRE